ncbi:hypothetical protein WJX84_012060 [Apatococcus fuscideae]|uniref:MSP domain-containing protein n=1 Tax=Apatococcus fuscideae TaxID=2026836 RepID=A0AAW1TDF2_9CHLO
MSDAAARFLKQPRLGPIAWLFQKYADGSFICLPHGLDSTLEQRHRPILAEEPVMKLDHAMLLLEDFSLVPQVLPRRDVRLAFRLAADTDHPAAAVTSIKAGIPAGQPRRLHLSQFCDFLVRIALAVSAKRPRPPPTLRGADVNPADQLQMFLREFGVAGAASVHLQDRVNLIFRQGDELRSHKKALLHWEYHLCKSGMDEAAKQARTFGGWSPVSSQPAPEALLSRVMQRDLSLSLTDIPSWHTLPSLALDLGSVPQGTRLGYRLLLRNRGREQLKVTAHAMGCPCVTLVYANTPICSGIPFIISVKVATDKPGPQQGVLEVCASMHAKTAPPSSHRQTIPFRVDVQENRREPCVGRNILTKQQIQELLTHQTLLTSPRRATPKSQVLSLV